MGGKLYEMFKDSVTAHLQNVRDEAEAALREVLNDPAAQGSEKLDAAVVYIQAVRNAWENHTVSIRMMRDVLMYLVRDPRLFGATRSDM